MDYFVIGQDGKEYGPASVDTLRQWAEQSRLSPQTMLKDSQTLQTLPASAVPGVFPPPMVVATPPVVAPVPAGNWSQPPNPSPYPRRPGMSAANDSSVLVGTAFRSVIALVLFFVLHGLGLIIAAYGVYYGYQAKSAGHRHGTIALVVTVVVFVVIAIGWLLRLAGVPI